MFALSLSFDDNPLPLFLNLLFFNVKKVHIQSSPGTSLNPFRQVLELLKTPSKTPQTPKASIELRDLRLDLSPPKTPRDTTGMSSKSADQRMVRAPDTHSAETGLIV